MPTPPPFKLAAYAHVARIGKAIASPTRLDILDLLAQGPRTVEALATQLGQTVANTSQHLQVLRRTRLVETERAGTFVTYRLAAPDVSAFLLQLRTLAHARLAEIEQLKRDYLEQRGVLEAVDSETLLDRIRTGDVTVLDVRPAEEFAAGHIPGAVSVPLAELRRRLKALPKRREVVAYCRGPYCVMALDAVMLLRECGFRAHRLEYGVTEWQARGGRLEAASDAARVS